MIGHPRMRHPERCTLTKAVQSASATGEAYLDLVAPHYTCFLRRVLIDSDGTGVARMCVGPRVVANDLPISHLNQLEWNELLEAHGSVEITLRSRRTPVSTWVVTMQFESVSL